MVVSSSRPYILGACITLTIIIILSLQTGKEASSTSSASSKWLDYSDKSYISSGHQSNRNYLSATSDTWIKPKPEDTMSEIGRASNATLGFERVFVIGPRARLDRRDAIVLSASLTGFKVEFRDGVNANEISDEARPPGFTLKDGALGYWRGQINVIRSIIEENIASAFIMQDDVDWDIRLPTQLREYARGIRHLSHLPISKPQHSPYGDDWDILWPGHCGEQLPSTFRKNNPDELYLIENDPTVAPKSVQAGLKGLADYPENTRIIHKVGAPACTFGYGISYRGAQKILLALAVKGGVNLAFDQAMAFLCRDANLNMKCYSVEPQLFQHHRPAGAKNKDGDAKGTKEKGVTDMIVWSARLNLEQMVMGRKDYHVQW